MKSAKLAIGVLACLPLMVSAEGMMERPDRGEFLDTVLEYVDESTAAELQTSRDDLTALRNEVHALRGSEDVDQVALQEAVANLRAGHADFREEVRAVIDGNEDLAAALEEARGNFDPAARHEHRGRRFHGGAKQ